MNTKNLDTFITVTKYNSINAAADALFISSPALQQHINRLETDVGFKPDGGRSNLSGRDHPAPV